MEKLPKIIEHSVLASYKYTAAIYLSHLALYLSYWFNAALYRTSSPLSVNIRARKDTVTRKSFFNLLWS